MRREWGQFFLLVQQEHGVCLTMCGTANEPSLLLRPPTPHQVPILPSAAACQRGRDSICCPFQVQVIAEWFVCGGFRNNNKQTKNQCAFIHNALVFVNNASGKFSYPWDGPLLLPPLAAFTHYHPDS